MVGGTAAVVAVEDEYEPETPLHRHRVCMWYSARYMSRGMIIIFILQFGYCCWLVNRAKPVCPNAGTTNPAGGELSCAAPNCAYDCSSATECKCQAASRYRAPILMTGFAIVAYIGLVVVLFLLIVNPCRVLPDGPVCYSSYSDGPRTHARMFAGLFVLVADVMVLASSAVSVSKVGADDTNWVPFPVSIIILTLTPIHLVAYCSFVRFDDLRDGLTGSVPQRQMKAKPPLPQPVPAAPKVDPTTAAASAVVTVFPPNKCQDFDTTKRPQPQPPTGAAAASDKASALIIVAPPDTPTV